MPIIEVRNQTELDAACEAQRADPSVRIHVYGCAEWGQRVVARGSSRVVARGSSHVEARGSSRVVARESSHVEAWESSHVVAWESSHVVAWESSHVVAWGSSRVAAWESSRVEASRFVAVHIHDTTPIVTGGVQIRVARPTTVAEWCDYYGVSIEDGATCVVYKAVRADLRSAHGLAYPLGGTVAAADWHAERECGGGLHFVPHPIMGLEFDSEATRFLACRIAVADCRAPRATDDYPHKIKARACVVLHEVDRWGVVLTP